MDLRQLRCFVAVAEEMHFGRAAERLHMAPPALSRVVRSLEDEIGARLLERTTRAVSLTRAGLGFLEDAQLILSRIDTAAQSARDQSTKITTTLRIGAIDAGMGGVLPAAVARLRTAHPDCDVRIIEAMTLPQIHMLRTGRLDIALVRMIEDSEFPFEPLRQEQLVVVVPDGHRLARKRQLTVRDARDEPFIIPSRRVRPYAYDLVMAYFAAADCVPRIALETTEKPAILAMVASGIGIAFVPDWVTTLRFKGVCYRPLADVPPSPLPPGAWLGMSWRPQQRHRLRDELIRELRSVAADYDPWPMTEPHPARTVASPIVRRSETTTR
ncbi:MAG: LysR family transcriptional regulator [Hyphomicrobiaceae bacterium]|nr:LysR family transcriptional regulator [Hyphomicrobiaceae bacterium]